MSPLALAGDQIYAHPARQQSPQDAPTDACKYLQIEEFRCLNATWLLCYFYSLKSLEEDPERKIEAFWFEPRCDLEVGKMLHFITIQLKDSKWHDDLLVLVSKWLNLVVENDMKPWVIQKQSRLNETSSLLAWLPLLSLRCNCNWHSSCTFLQEAILKGNYSTKPQMFVGFRMFQVGRVSFSSLSLGQSGAPVSNTAWDCSQEVHEVVGCHLSEFMMTRVSSSDTVKVRGNRTRSEDDTFLPQIWNQRGSDSSNFLDRGSF